MAKAMIISVGKTVAPIKKTILNNEPEKVCFLVSHESANLLGEIKTLVESAGFTYRQTVEIVSDPESLTSCFEAAVECIKTLDIENDDVIVDYTGGTKAMSAALVLAMTGRGFSCNYVGGTVRREDSTGRVMDGYEVIHKCIEPRTFFAVEEKKNLSGLINSYWFKSAEEILDRLIRTGGNLKNSGFFKPLKVCVMGYRSWDLFKHQDALEKLEEGEKGLSPAANVAQNKTLIKYVNELRDNINFLKEFEKKSQGFKKLHSMTVVDLLSNAQRRAEEGKFDDAVARIYRALEMIGQIEFKRTFHVDTGKVPPDKIPESLRNEYRNRYLDDKKKNLRFGLEATFRALAAAGNSLGKQFMENYLRDKGDTLKGLLGARNQSILAHGTTPVTQETYQRFMDQVTELFNFSEWVRFPKLEGDW